MEEEKTAKNCGELCWCGEVTAEKKIKVYHCLGNKISKSHKGPEVDKDRMSGETPNTRGKNSPVFVSSFPEGHWLCV